jgi:mono/diheme cytochrome c family protein
MKGCKQGDMEFLYQFLQKFGFGHPLHPALIHVPIGLVIGAFVFVLTALVLKREDYLTTALRCIVLALISLVPAVLAGVTDWYHFYAGAWSFAIKIKFVLTGVLVILLGAAVVMEVKKIGSLPGRAFVYFLCVAAVAALGYYGAELIYPGQGLAVNDKQLKAGEKLYAVHCAGCHPGGGNTLNPELPVTGSAYLKDLNAFAKFNRQPFRPDGSKGLMPAYPEDKISDAEMARIYQYVTRVLAVKQ